MTSRYLSFNQEIKKTFGERIDRITINTGMTCPNIDGKKAKGAWCVDFVEHLRPNIIIQRLEAHGPRELTVAPQWSINKMATLNAIHAELEKRNSWQGRLSCYTISGS